MLEKKFTNEDLGIEMNSYIDNKQNVWFRGKDVAEILGYSKPRNAIERHVSYNHKMLQLYRGPETRRQLNDAGGPETRHQQNDARGPETRRQQNDARGPETKRQQNDARGPETRRQQNDTRGKYCILIDEAGFYELVFSSKLEAAKKFRDWVFTTVLPSIRKYGQYKLFDSPWNKMIMTGNETDLHYKVVDLLMRYYPDSILVAGLGENQDREDKRLDSYKKGYTKDQPDLMILGYHKDYKGLCIEFKSPTNNYNISEAQLKTKEKYRNNDYAFILSNDYDKISKNIHKYMAGVRIPCKYCTRAFRNKKTLNKHYKVIHKIEK